MKSSLAFLLSLITLFAVSPPAYAATSSTYHYQRLFYYREGDLAKKSFYAHYASIDIFAPQSYKIAADGTISGSVDKDVLAFAKLHNVRVMPLVTNGGFSRDASKEFLGDSAKETTAINALIAEAHDRGYWGYQFDFEQMDAGDKSDYTAFIARAYAAFHAKGLALSVAVVGKTSDNPKDYPNDLWNNLIGVYDYTALAANADFITVMSYDDPFSKGPVAPLPWYQSIVNYTIAHVPNNKISLGIPTYYWQWSVSTGKLVGIGGNEGIDNVFAKYHPASTYDNAQAERKLTYKSSTGLTYNLWYEDTAAIARRISIATTNHLYGASFWALGLEIPGTFTAVKE
jgi:spore germination protein YaaH